MKQLFLSVILSLTFVASAYADSASEAKKVLDKTASVVNSKDGVQANFVLTGERMGRVAGTIAIKGNKFNAVTPEATVWYDGKTQWTYTNKTDEVNISTPTREQQVLMNPLTFINLYKTGYRLSLIAKSSGYEVRMVAESKDNAVQEVYVVVDKSSYVPTQVRVRRKIAWMTINISDFKNTPQSDNTFVFNSKEFPTAEIVDLR